jgi:alpha-tubulin suppressor-like RCC1 family protein
MTLHGLVLGSAHACGLTADGQAVCWGSNTYGQLGLGASDTDVHAPTPTGGALRFTMLSAGTNDTCGVATSGALYCWGANFYGQIGDGTTIDRAAPTAAKLGPAMASVATAASRTCALAAGGEAYCWGATSLGNGTSFGASTIPVRVAPPQ